MARYNILEPLLFVASFWIVHLAIAGLLSAPIVFFGRHRAQWRPWDLIVFVAPYWSWSICMLIDNSGKSLSNLVEMLCVTVFVPIALLVRCAVEHPRWRGFVTAGITVLLSGLAVGLWAFVPALPE